MLGNNFTPYKRSSLLYSKETESALLILNLLSNEQNRVANFFKFIIE